MANLSKGLSVRLFGGDIPDEVKDKLWLRQELNYRGIGMFDSIETIKSPFSKEPDGTPKTLTVEDFTGLTGEDKGLAELSSRTPFARIWTAIEIVEKVKITDTPQELMDKGLTNPDDTDNYDSNFFCDGTSGRSQCWQYTIDPTGKSLRIYSIGNHVLNTTQINPGDSLDNVTDTLATLAPPEQSANSNEFMRPAAGITSITSQTEGGLGPIKKTTVNFLVHNFHDFDRIYSTYFLKHGAQIFIDFGWTVNNLYDPKKLIQNSNGKIDDDLYGPKGHVTRASGDLEVLIGHVINYDAKIQENGSVECSIEVISKNAALIDRNFNEEGDKLKSKITYSLDMEVMRFGASAFSGPSAEAIKNSNWTMSPTDQKSFDYLFSKFAEKNLGASTNNAPMSGSLLSGVFFGGTTDTAKNLYVSWGFFEDKVLNTEFGFGPIKGNAVQDKRSVNLESRFDSSNTFVRYDKFLALAQKTKRSLDTTATTRLNFLYPNSWDETYSTVRDKVPQGRLDENNVFIPSGGKIYKARAGHEPQVIGIVNYTSEDINLERIPLRELFIPVNLIKEALGKTATSVTKFIQYILDAVNKSSQEIFDIRLGTNKYASTEFSFIDRNFLGEANREEDFLDTLFVFKPNSPNSIVKGYDLSFSAPQGGLQNMLAIQGMGAGGKVFPATAVLDNLLATEVSHLGGAGQLENTRIRYLPFIGGYRGKKLHEDGTTNASIQLKYHKDDIIFGNVGASDDTLMSVAGKLSDNDVKFLLNPSANSLEAATLVEVEAAKSDLPKEGEIEAIEAGIKLASSVSEFWAFNAKGNFYATRKSSIVQLELTLSIYGIATLVPGDLLKVDYLPKRYLDTVYFQVIQVSHNITPSTWTTTLKTIMRVGENKKRNSGLYYIPQAICMTRTILKEYPMYPEMRIQITPYIKQLKLSTQADNDKDIMKFTFKGAKSGTIDTWWTTNSLTAVKGYIPKTGIIVNDDGTTQMTEFDGEATKYPLLGNPNQKSPGKTTIWKFTFKRDPNGYAMSYRETYTHWDYPGIISKWTHSEHYTFTSSCEIIEGYDYVMYMKHGYVIVIPMWLQRDYDPWYAAVLVPNKSCDDPTKPCPKAMKDKRPVQIIPVCGEGEYINYACQDLIKYSTDYPEYDTEVNCVYATDGDLCPDSPSSSWACCEVPVDECGIPYGSGARYPCWNGSTACYGNDIEDYWGNIQVEGCHQFAPSPDMCCPAYCGSEYSGTYGNTCQDVSTEPWNGDSSSCTSGLCTGDANNVCCPPFVEPVESGGIGAPCEYPSNDMCDEGLVCYNDGFCDT